MDQGSILTRAPTSLFSCFFYRMFKVYEAEYGPEADLWSLGIITYECLVGIVPFHGGVPLVRSAAWAIHNISAFGPIPHKGDIAYHVLVYF